MGVIMKFEIKGENKFEINLLPNIEIVDYNKLFQHGINATQKTFD